MVYPVLLYMLLGIGGILTAEPLSAIQSAFKIVYRIRIYQSVGQSREQWREMTPPATLSPNELTEDSVAGRSPDRY